MNRVFTLCKHAGDVVRYAGEFGLTAFRPVARGGRTDRVGKDVHQDPHRHAPFVMMRRSHGLTPLTPSSERGGGALRE